VPKNEFWRELRHKTQGRLLLFWVVSVFPMGVLYGHMGIIKPQTAIMAA
jgi:hypothetical protein